MLIIYMLCLQKITALAHQLLGDEHIFISLIFGGNGKNTLDRTAYKYIKFFSVSYSLSWNKNSSIVETGKEKSSYH